MKKKKIVTLVITGILLLSSMNVFANETVTPTVTAIAVVTSTPIVITAEDIVITSVGSELDVAYKDQLVQFDVLPQIINEITMIPLRATLEAMGYTVEWNNDTRSVNISKGAQWTSIKIGENLYFKNKMTPSPLSSAPVIVNSRTLVPVEFFSEIIGKGIEVENKNIKFVDESPAFYAGYIKDMTFDETKALTITITSDKNSEDVMNLTIIHTNESFTFYNTAPRKGAFINVIASPISTMSIPAQTAGYVIY